MKKLFSIFILLILSLKLAFATDYTIYATSNGGYIDSFSATYSLARAGTGTFDVQTGQVLYGQEGSGGLAHVYEGFIEFDTSTVSGTVSVATLSLYIDNLIDEHAFTIDARLRDWGGGTLTSAAWVAGASLSGLTQLGTKTSATVTTNVYNAFTSTGSFPAAIVVGGTTRMLITTNDTIAGTDPVTDSWYGTACFATNCGGTTNPRLFITAVATASGSGLSLMGVGK